MNRLSQDPEEIARCWYVPATPSPRAGWLLYTEDFVLRTLQDCHNRPERLSRSVGWRMLAWALMAMMGICQAFLIVLSRIPVLSWFVQTAARIAPRNAVGFFIRGCYWKANLESLGVDTFIDQDVDIRYPQRVRIGSCCHIDRGTLLSAGTEDGSIVIGDYAFLGPSCHVAGRGGVEIGEFAGLAASVHVYSVSNSPVHPERPGELISMSHTAPPNQQYTIAAPVRIGEYAIVGYGALVLPGVTLGRGVVVHPMAEVRSSFPDYAVLSGHGRSRRQGWRRPGKLDPRLADQDN